MDDKYVFDCPHSSECGGCSYNNIPYEKQLEKKEGRIRGLFAQLPVVNSFKPDRIVAAACPYHYRNKVHGVLGYRRSKIICGLYSEDSHKLVNVTDCLIEDEVASAVIAGVAELAGPFKYTIFDEDKGRGFLRHVLVRVAHSRGEKKLLVVIVTALKEFPRKNDFVKALTAKFPMIESIVWNYNPRRTSMVLSDNNTVIYGPGYIVDDMLGLRFAISAGSFYQVNHEGAEKMYSLAREFAGLTGKERVLDAYCGTGTIGMLMCDRAESVTGVELNESAVRDAVFNKKLNKIKNYRVLCADATKYISGLRGKDAFDVVIMDPPRAGSTPAFIDAVVRSKVRKVVYISCNPETLVRDLRLFIKGGFVLKKAVPIDMFPGTSHVEVCCLLEQLYSCCIK
ncbi:MAG: 23S rRNA (uracil(1939)-C(5))-methyltransferase RlmD [Lachnospiraceae bacterium]|nr:23S rRNA (uracil(1939)-C(5))-methyltransferase RlmD [Lachnospiraceae bacterium]